MCSHITLSCPQLGSAILEAVEQNTLSVEPVGFQPLPVVKASAVECGGPKWDLTHKLFLIELSLLHRHLSIFPHFPTLVGEGLSSSRKSESVSRSFPSAFNFLLFYFATPPEAFEFELIPFFNPSFCPGLSKRSWHNKTLINVKNV